MLNYYKVEFLNGHPGLGPFIHVLAHNADDAAILAKAARLLSGQRDHVIEHVWAIKDSALLKKVKALAEVPMPRIFDIDALP
jgi:hypothetical protein